jgi:hypothetical protein
MPSLILKTLIFPSKIPLIPAILRKIKVEATPSWVKIFKYSTAGKSRAYLQKFKAGFLAMKDASIH